MTDIVDLTAYRRNKDDDGYFKYDDDGVKMYNFALEYQMDGSRWGLEVWAYSWEDAQNRVDAMRQSLVLLGQTHAIIPA